MFPWEISSVSGEATPLLRLGISSHFGTGNPSSRAEALSCIRLTIALTSISGIISSRRRMTSSSLKTSHTPFDARMRNWSESSRVRQLTKGFLITLVFKFGSPWFPRPRVLFTTPLTRALLSLLETSPLAFRIRCLSFLSQGLWLSDKRSMEPSPRHNTARIFPAFATYKLFPRNRQVRAEHPLQRFLDCSSTP